MGTIGTLGTHTPRRREAVKRRSGTNVLDVFCRLPCITRFTRVTLVQILKTRTMDVGRFGSQLRGVCGPGLARCYPIRGLAAAQRQLSHNLVSAAYNIIL